MNASTVGEAVESVMLPPAVKPRAPEPTTAYAEDALVSVAFSWRLPGVPALVPTVASWSTYAFTAPVTLETDLSTAPLPRRAPAPPVTFDAELAPRVALTVIAVPELWILVWLPREARS